METQAIEQVEKKVGSLQLNVTAIAIRDQQTYGRAVEYLQTVKDMQVSDEMVQLEDAKLAAHDAHKKISDLYNRVMNPLKAMEQLLKTKILTWDRAKQAEEDAKRRKAEEERQAAIRKEQERLAAEARAKAKAEADARAEQMRKEAVEKAKADAERMRREGESKRAIAEAQAKAKAASDRKVEAERKQAEADALARTAVENAEKIATMEAAPIPETKPAYERSAAVQTRDNWMWEFTGATDEQKIKSIYILVCHIANNPGDLYLLEPEKLLETHPALNKLAKAQKTM